MLFAVVNSTSVFLGSSMCDIFESFLIWNTAFCSAIEVSLINAKKKI